MKVSTKLRYAIRFLIDLAVHNHQQTVPLKDIAKRQEISEKYLWQVAVPLKAAGLVEAARGSHGGFRLARPAGRVTILQVAQIVEGPVALVACVNDPRLCARSTQCSARELWTDLSGLLAHALQGITIEDLADKQRQRAQTTEPAYEI